MYYLNRSLHFFEQYFKIELIPKWYVVHEFAVELHWFCLTAACLTSTMWKEGWWLWCPSCNKCLWWLSLPVLWAFWIRKMECASSQLCGCHMTFHPTAILSPKQLSVQHLLQKLYFYSRFCFASWMCTFVSSTFCLSCLSFYLHYPILFTNAHYWISWRSKLSSSNPFLLITILGIKLSIVYSNNVIPIVIIIFVILDKHFK